jgi:hypothetical protein
LTVSVEPGWAACSGFVKLSDEVAITKPFWTHDPKVARYTANNPAMNAIKTMANIVTTRVREVERPLLHSADCVCGIEGWKKLIELLFDEKRTNQVPIEVVMAAALEEDSLAEGLLLIELETTGYSDLLEEVKCALRDDDIIPVYGQVHTRLGLNPEIFTRGESQCVKYQGLQLERIRVAHARELLKSSPALAIKIARRAGNVKELHPINREEVQDSAVRNSV